MSGPHGRRRKSVLAVWRDAIRDDPELDLTAKCVAFILSTYMDGQGVAFPSRETLRRGASLRSVRSVDRALATLAAADYLEIDRSTGGRGQTSTYSATVHGVALFELDMDLV